MRTKKELDIVLHHPVCLMYGPPLGAWEEASAIPPPPPSSYNTQKNGGGAQDTIVGIYVLHISSHWEVRNKSLWNSSSRTFI